MISHVAPLPPKLASNVALCVGLFTGRSKICGAVHSHGMKEVRRNNRKAALVGNLTNRGFRVVADGRALDCTKSRAIYVGEDLPIKRIQHSILVNIPHQCRATKLYSTAASGHRLSAWLLECLSREEPRLRTPDAIQSPWRHL
jgi:hypothetical protein